MTNKEFINYMQICGRMSLHEFEGNTKVKSDIDIFKRSKAEVWKYWILLESIEMPMDSIFYAMRIMIEHNLKDKDIKELIESMRLLSRTVVISWYDICRKVEENLIKGNKTKSIVINSSENLPIIINDEYITIDWRDDSFDSVDIVVEDERHESIKCLVIKSDKEFEWFGDEDKEYPKGLEIFFEKRKKVWRVEQ